MALDARRRQKKAEKRRAKEKAKRKALATRKATDMGQRLARVAAAPVLHACTQQGLWDSGIAQVLVSRELDSGMVVFSIFLVDRYCLGVKDAFCGFMARSEYFDRIYEKLDEASERVSLKPAAARKLVEEAVAYASDLGLAPHRGYAHAREIFGDIDPAASDRQFEFGRDGKPYFVAGPHDSPGRCYQIVNILTERLGEGNFYFTLPLAGGQLPEGLSLEDLEFEDSEEEFMEDDSDDDEWTIEGAAQPSDAAQPADKALFGFLKPRWFKG